MDWKKRCGEFLAEREELLFRASCAEQRARDLEGKLSHTECDVDFLENQLKKAGVKPFANPDYQTGYPDAIGKRRKDGDQAA